MTDTKILMDAARQQVAENLHQLAVEAHEAEITGILCDGKYREIARSLTPITDVHSRALGIVDVLLRSEMLKFVIKCNNA